MKFFLNFTEKTVSRSSKNLAQGILRWWVVNFDYRYLEFFTVLCRKCWNGKEDGEIIVLFGCQLHRSYRFTLFHFPSLSKFQFSRYHLKDVIVGKIYFLLVRIKIKHMELAIIKRETTGTGEQLNACIHRFSIFHTRVSKPSLP